jgi:transcriptional regulator with XRE-family HTH domain
MPPLSPLASYVTDRLADRHESADQFARRIGINASGLYKWLRGTYGTPQHRNLEKIAAGLNMSAGELLAAVDVRNGVAHEPPPEDTLAETIRFPVSLRQRALQVARDDDRTFSSLVIHALRRYVTQH